MRYLDLVSTRCEVFTHLIGDHHGPVMAACAPESDGQIALSFPDVMRQQINQKIRDPLYKLAGLRERANITRHRRVSAGQLFESWNVVRVRQKTDVEHQIAV